MPDNEATRIAFPLSTAPKHFRNWWKGRSDYFPQDSRPIIESFQPYNRGDWRELILLYHLALLSNFDKHRIITTTRAETAVTLSDDSSGTVRILGSSSNDPSYGRLLYAIPDDFQPKITVEIFLNPGAGHPRLRIPIAELRDIHDFIRDGEFPRFQGILE